MALLINSDSVVARWTAQILKFQPSSDSGTAGGNTPWETYPRGRCLAECSRLAQENVELAETLACIHSWAMELAPEPLLPLPPLPDGSIPTRSPERRANLIRFQSELEVSSAVPQDFMVEPSWTPSKCLLNLTLSSLCNV